MALGVNVARERAEEWVQQIQAVVAVKRDEVERRVEGVVRRIFSSLQIVTADDVAEIDAKLKTIAQRIDQIEARRRKTA